MKRTDINQLKSIYPQLNVPQVSRRSLLALGSIFTLGLAGCGGSGEVENNPPAPPPPVANAGVVTTLAGSGARSFADGTGRSAQFSRPSSIAVDANGTVYVSDYENHVIRKITTAGEVTTLAGLALTSGYQDGTGSAALFSYPIGLAVDASGTVYVADYGNHVIRKITSEGVVTTFAGTPSQSGGYADGAAALFSSPSGITVDGAGNLYVADSINHLIRKITPEGNVTTVAGIQGVSGSLDGTGVNASFYRPWGITRDTNGNLYVTDQYNNMIRMISPAGVVTTLAGATDFGGLDGVGSAARFSTPMGISIDQNGSLYVVEFNNSAIRKIDIATGTVTSFAGDILASGYVDATGIAARFRYSQGVAVDSKGVIYVADTYNNMIRKIA